MRLLGDAICRMCDKEPLYLSRHGFCGGVRSVQELCVAGGSERMDEIITRFRSDAEDACGFPPPTVQVAKICRDQSQRRCRAEDQSRRGRR